MSRTTKQKIGNGLFAFALGVLAFLAALPAFAQDAAPPVDLATLPVPALMSLSAFGVFAIVRAIRGAWDVVAESKRWTAVACGLLGLLAGALGLSGAIGDGLPGQLFAGLVAGALAFWSAGATGPKARLES